MTEIEHKLSDVQYGIGRIQVPDGDGKVTGIVLLKFSTTDGSESWLFPLGQKAADDIAAKLSGQKQSIVPASFGDLRKFAQ